MQIALANPRRSPFTGEWITAPHQGLLSLAAAVREGTFYPTTGCAVNVYDDQLRFLTGEWTDHGDFLDGLTPDIVGVQAVTSGISNACAIAARAKRHDRNVLTVLGGVGPTQEAEDLVRAGRADVVVLGEAELSFSALVHEYGEHGKAGFPAVPGIVYRDDDGVVQRNAPGKPLNDLDRLPMPARDLVDVREYSRVSHGRAGNLITSRGCSYACAYCYSRHHWGIGQRRFSLQRVLAEIHELVDIYGVDRIRIEDDDFLENREWVDAFCDALISCGLNRRMEWEAKARPDHMELGILRRLRESGCFRLLMGVETLDFDMLRKLSRPVAVETTARALDVMREADIGVQATLILGIPGESDRAMRHTLTWLQERLQGPRDIVSPCFFVPFFDEIGKAMSRRFTYSVEERDRDRYTGHVPITASDACSFTELWALYEDLSPTRRGTYARTAHLATLDEVLSRMLPVGSDAIAP